jgi:DNA-binding MarR family transcriptional regulator
MEDIAPQPQITRHVLRLFSLMTADLLSWWWGKQLSDELSLKSGTIYPLLARLEKAGWLESRWEEINPSEEGRPRRRLYRLTGEGQRVANEALAEIGQLKSASPSPAAGHPSGLPEVRWT